MLIDIVPLGTIIDCFLEKRWEDDLVFLFYFYFFKNMLCFLFYVKSIPSNLISKLEQ